VLFIQGANPAVTCPDQGAVMRALARDDVFTIVHEQVLTDTARFADIVLPAPTHFEVDDVAPSYGSYTLQPIRAVIDRIGESRANDEVASAIAIALGLPVDDFDPDPARLIYAFITDGLGAGPRAIRRGTVQFIDTFPDRRVQLIDPAGGAPQFVPANPTSREIERFPLVLLTPATSKTVNTMLGESPGAPPRVHLNASDAQRRGIADGDWVVVSNDRASIDVRCRVGADVRTGVCWMGKGFWPRDFPGGMSANSLCPASSESTTGGACFNDTYVEVTRST
jgi:anaerobic selenocysteine-containing dehydrogenase